MNNDHLVKSKVGLKLLICINNETLQSSVLLNSSRKGGEGHWALDFQCHRLCRLCNDQPAPTVSLISSSLEIREAQSAWRTPRLSKRMMDDPRWLLRPDQMATPKEEDSSPLLSAGGDTSSIASCSETTWKNKRGADLFKSGGGSSPFFSRWYLL